ncbi:hypothetical protein GCM10009841_26730 [Microlunatus panaciterrae]|uniref:Uncharacterized protein n=1 Tax=Microlunatus panaciterrae TaxID=400768 RepID=A0ABS2RHG3_9ACTN|nr:hypothetical protein [Microlunatus panaciterrae]MBM7798444.1 hypothetical protein [Microlunatus panaciterrae]
MLIKVPVRHDRDGVDNFTFRTVVAPRGKPFDQRVTAGGHRGACAGERFDEFSSQNSAFQLRKLAF